MNNKLDVLESEELVSKLSENGQSELVDCLLLNEQEVYTKKGRLNKSSLCRKLGWRQKQLEDAIKQMREILKKDFDIDD